MGCKTNNQPLDFQNVAQSFSKAALSYQAHAHMQNAMGRFLLACLRKHGAQTHWGKVLEMGCGPGNFTQVFLSEFSCEELLLNDISSKMLQQALSTLPLWAQAHFKTQSNLHPEYAGQQSASLPEPGFNPGLEPESLLDEQKLKQSVEYVPQPALKHKFGLEMQPAIEPVSNNFAFQNVTTHGPAAPGADADSLNNFQALSFAQRASFKNNLSPAPKPSLEQWVGGMEATLPAIKPLWGQTKLERFQLPKLTPVLGDVLQVLPTLPQVDLVVSNALVQWLPLDKVLVECRKITPLLAFSSFTTGTFAEFASLGLQGLEYLSLDQVKSTLSAYAKDYQIVSQVHKQHFASISDLMRHLSATGVNALGRDPLTPGALRKLLRLYAERYQDERGIYLTWCPYYAIVRLI